MSKNNNHNNLILIAEENLTNVEDLKYILENKGYKVVRCVNGQETLNMAKKANPVMIITDVFMSVIDGYELCRQIKADENLKQIPVVLLTTLTDAEDVFKGLECGADSYVMKPFNEKHFISRIETILTNRSSLKEQKEKQESVVDILIKGKKYLVHATRFQALNMLFSIYEVAVEKTHKLTEIQTALSSLHTTLEKKTEEKEKKYHVELRAAKEKAEESDRLKTAFLSNMSHEVRTPMNAITGFSSLLSDPDISNNDRKEFVNRISESCYSLSTLVENILDIAKLEAGHLKIYKKKCSLNKLLTNIYSTFSKEKRISGKDQISFRLYTAIKEKDFNILADPFRIYQILSNLLDNAFKYTDKGYVEFGYTVQRKMLQFYVKDTGIGITEDHKGFVFERFRKAEDIKTKLYGGAGLGLAICKKLTELLGGGIWVESELGKGSTFYFTIPLEVTEKPVEEPEKKIPAYESDALKDKTILVAEDNLLNYKLIEAILAKTEARISWAKDGVEAVEFVSSGHEFDLVLMDIRMPNMDGFQATQEIRKLKKELPVIAITAYGRGDEKDLAMNTGFNDYLTKPVSSEKLIETVNKYIYKGKIG